MSRWLATSHGYTVLDKLKGTARLENVPLWQRETNPGYALGTSTLNEAFERDGKKDPVKLTDDTAYKALSSATKASFALAEQLSSANKPRRYAVVFPAIAVRGQLYECWLHDDDIELKDVRQAQVRWSYPGSPTGSVLIDIVTEDRIDAFANDVIVGARAFFEQATDTARTLHKSRPKGPCIRARMTVNERNRRHRTCAVAGQASVGVVVVDRPVEF